MPPHRLTYEELYEAYLGLQSRVTRFSSTEQELINVRDLLDQERLVYKRMNDFHAAAIEAHDIPALLALIAETVVDLFETELGFAAFRCPTEPRRNAQFMEGGAKARREEWFDAFVGMVDDGGNGPGDLILDEDGKTGAPLDRCFIGRRMKPHSMVELVVMGGVSDSMAESYGPFNNKTASLLKLFTDSCASYLDNIISAERINMQLETIRQSELEQRRLSLIATNTHSGVIITDSHGCIQWVNDAFTLNTGYELGEVIGLKPKDFLQENGGNRQETLDALSAALWKHENINVGLKNRRKNGESFYINLNITPVFDQDHHLINFIAIQQDITDQKLYEERIVEQNDALTKINRELDHFVYSISHDLRAPLLSIQGLLGLIEFSEQEAGNQEYLGLIGESVARLDNTILDILNYSRNARLDVVHAEFDLRMTIDDMLRDLSSLRPDVRVQVEWQGSKLVRLDEVRLGVLLKNIVSNAIKYSRSGIDDAHVLIRVENSPEVCLIVVRDNGEGIPEVHLPKVFDMFYRATNSSSGTGLGLYICKEVVDKLGGSIDLKSTPGVGTEVSVSLPQIKTVT